MHRTLPSREMVTTGSVSVVLGERIAMVRPVSTMSLIETWTLPALSRTSTPASGSLNPPGPGWTGPGLAAAALTTGVPALADQPGWKGPVNAHTPDATRIAAPTIAATARKGRAAGPPWRSRNTSANTTAVTHEVTTAINHGAWASLPVPSPWITASGHDAYAAQWVNRHGRGPIRSRSKLLATTPIRTHIAATPRPSQMGL